MNNGHYTLCPYFLSEHGKSIRCEDTLRTFRWKPQKERWMSSYCDSDWKGCRWAQELEKAYKGSDEDLEEQKISALETEIRALTSKLGRSEKRCEAKDEEIRKARNNRDKWERAYQRKAKECAELNRSIAEERAITATLTISFEARLAYAMSQLERKITETEIEAWLKQNNYVLKTDKDEKGHVIAWWVELNG